MATATTAGTLARTKRLHVETGRISVTTVPNPYPKFIGNGSRYLTLVCKYVSKGGDSWLERIAEISYETVSNAERGHDRAVNKYLKPKRKR